MLQGAVQPARQQFQRISAGVERQSRRERALDAGGNWRRPRVVDEPTVHHLPIEPSRPQMHYPVSADRQCGRHVGEHACRGERRPLAAGKAGMIHLPVQSDDRQFQPARGVRRERGREKGDRVQRRRGAPGAAGEPAVPDSSVRSNGDQLLRIAGAVQGGSRCEEAASSGR